MVNVNSDCLLDLKHTHSQTLIAVDDGYSSQGVTKESPA